MPTEVEARFRADEPGQLRRLAAIPAIGDAELGPPRTVDEVDVYLDTPGGALAAARWACRLRRRDDRVAVSLKGPPEPATGASSLHRRPEVEGPATPSSDPGDWPPSAARDLLDSLRGGEPLVERLTLRQRRTERAVTLEGSALGTLSLDVATVEVAGRPRGEFRIVELELAAEASGREDALGDLARTLGTRESLEPERRTKLERALELISTR
jgi:inorganic triphosphatase YgiF